MIQPKASWPDWMIKVRMPEFWYAWLIYLYPFIYVVWHTIRLRNKFWPVIINPAIDELGGFVGASKSHINSLFPQEFIPKSIEWSGEGEKESFITGVATEIGYPCFIKPDNLMRGMGVEKLENEAELREYLDRVPGLVFVQRALTQTEEYGVFISRIPGEKVKILSLTGKVFLTVTGDGKSSIKELLSGNIRYKLARKFINPKWQDKFHKVLPAGETLLIQPVGNHNKGTHFRDLSDQITPAMETLFDRIVPDEGVYYGRFDIKANNLDALETGEDMGIIEFNGTVAEPVSYCDSRYHFIKGQWIIMKHFREQLKIAEVLIKKGALAPGLLDGIRIIRKAKQFENENAFTFND